MFFANSTIIVIITSMFDFLKNISPTEVVIILVILIVLFGARFMIGLGRTSGETVKEIKKVKKEFNNAISDDDKPNKT